MRTHTAIVSGARFAQWEGLVRPLVAQGISQPLPGALHNTAIGVLALARDMAAQPQITGRLMQSNFRGLSPVILGAQPDRGQFKFAGAPGALAQLPAPDAAKSAEYIARLADQRRQAFQAATAIARTVGGDLKRVEMPPVSSQGLLETADWQVELAQPFADAVAPPYHGTKQYPGVLLSPDVLSDLYFVLMGATALMTRLGPVALGGAVALDGDLREQTAAPVLHALAEKSRAYEAKYKTILMVGAGSAAALGIVLLLRGSK